MDALERLKVLINSSTPIVVMETVEEVRAATLDVLEKGGDRGMILSVGGGTSPGMPRENILAMLAALNEFNGRR